MGELLWDGVEEGLGRDLSNITGSEVLNSEGDVGETRKEPGTQSPLPPLLLNAQLISFTLPPPTLQLDRSSQS
jgi:hypothetical protein